MFPSIHILWLLLIKIYSEEFKFCLVVDFHSVILLCSVLTKANIIIISQSVIFKPPVFHPVINMDTGELDVKRAFPKWRQQEWLCIYQTKFDNHCYLTFNYLFVHFVEISSPLLSPKVLKIIFYLSNIKPKFPLIINYNC